MNRFTPSQTASPPSFPHHTTAVTHISPTLCSHLFPQMTKTKGQKKEADNSVIKDPQQVSMCGVRVVSASLSQSWAQEHTSPVVSKRDLWVLVPPTLLFLLG